MDLFLFVSGKKQLSITFLILTVQVIEEEDGEEDALYKTMEIEVKGHEVAVLNSYEKFVSMAAHELDITISKMWVYTFLKELA